MNMQMSNRERKKREKGTMEESDKNKRNKKKKSEMKQKKKKKKKTQNNVNVQRLVTEKERKKLAKKNVQGHFGQLMLVNFSSKFSSHFGKKIFWWPEKKTLESNHIFFRFPSQPNTH